MVNWQHSGPADRCLAVRSYIIFQASAALQELRIVGALLVFHSVVPGASCLCVSVQTPARRNTSVYEVCMLGQNVPLRSKAGHTCVWWLLVLAGWQGMASSALCAPVLAPAAAASSGDMYLARFLLDEVPDGSKKKQLSPNHTTCINKEQFKL